jgi:hypothetical protein
LFLVLSSAFSFRLSAFGCFVFAYSLQLEACSCIYFRLSAAVFVFACGAQRVACRGFCIAFGCFVFAYSLQLEACSCISTFSPCSDPKQNPVYFLSEQSELEFVFFMEMSYEFVILTILHAISITGIIF